MPDVRLAEALLFASRLTEAEARAVAAQLARAAAAADLAAARAVVRARGGRGRAIAHILNSSKV